MKASSRRLWSPEESAVLKELLGAGLSIADIADIAERMKRPLGSVATRLYAEKARTQRPQRPWTESELEKVLDLRDAGAPYKEIEAATGRARTAIQKKIKSLDSDYLRRRRAKQRRDQPLPVAQSDWMQPLTRAQLMGGHA